MSAEKSELGYVDSHYVKDDPIAQAKAIWEKEIQPRLDAGEKVGFIYAANNDQANSIIDGYSTNTTGTIGGSGQAKVFAELNNLIKANNAADKVHVLPIATSLHGGSDDLGNTVDKASIDRDLINILAHKDAGFSVIGFSRPNGQGEREFSVGGGMSQNFVNDTSFLNSQSRFQYMQSQLEKIQKNEKDTLDPAIVAGLSSANQQMQPASPIPQAPPVIPEAENPSPVMTSPTDSASPSVVDSSMVEKTEPKPPVEVGAEPVMDKDTSPDDQNEKKNSFIEKALASYKEYSQDEQGKYKKGFAEPEVEGDKTKFFFPDNQSATEFFKDFAEKNKDENFVLMNKEGEIVARIENGKLQVFNGKDGFEDANENTVIPKTGMSAAAFNQLSKSEASTTNSEDIKAEESLQNEAKEPISSGPLKTDKIEKGNPGEIPAPNAEQLGGITETLETPEGGGSIKTTAVNPPLDQVAIGKAVDELQAKQKAAPLIGMHRISDSQRGVKPEIPSVTTPQQGSGMSSPANATSDPKAEAEANRRSTLS